MPVYRRPALRFRMPKFGPQPYRRQQKSRREKFAAAF